MSEPVTCLREIEAVLEQAAQERADGLTRHSIWPRAIITESTRAADYRLRLLRRHIKREPLAQHELNELQELARWLEQGGHGWMARGLFLTLM